jgi:hypothetical protein
MNSFKFIEQRKQSINTSCICSLFKYCSNFVKMNYEKSIICYLVINKKLVVRKTLSQNKI